MSRKVKCKICGKMYSSLLSHLKTHNLSLKKYLNKFPNAQYESKSLRKRRSEKASEINKGRVVSEKTRKKISTSLKNSPKKLCGEKHHRWNPEVETNYNSDFCNKINTKIKERDGYECQNKNCRKNSNSLIVHHKDFDSFNDHPDNLETLCRSCHAIKHNVHPSKEVRAMRTHFPIIPKDKKTGRFLKKEEW